MVETETSMGITHEETWTLHSPKTTQSEEKVEGVSQNPSDCINKLELLRSRWSIDITLKISNCNLLASDAYVSTLLRTYLWRIWKRHTISSWMFSMKM